jgi:hypothetical protein
MYNCIDERHSKYPHLKNMITRVLYGIHDHAELVMVIQDSLEPLLPRNCGHNGWRDEQVLSR